MNAPALISELTRIGVELKVEDEHLRVRAARGVLTPELQKLIATHKAEMIQLLRPAVATPNASLQFEPFPLTDIQETYFVGRGMDFGLSGMSCHLYHELDTRGLDVARLSRAWQRLIEQHVMLRSVVLPSGEQRVLESVPPFSIPVLDLRGQASTVVDAKLAEIRKELSTRSTPPGQWPTFELRATLLDDGRTRIHFDFDAITADASAVLTLLEEWREFYLSPDRPLKPVPITFRDHVLAEEAARDTDSFRQAQAYWMERLKTMPDAPALPIATEPERLMRPSFGRLSGRLDAARWARLKEHAANAGLTASGVVCAAFSEVLGTWSETPHFTLNLTLFRRLPIHPEVDRLLGDFTTNVLLEVDRSGESFTARAVRLRDQLAEDLEHTHFSGVRVMRERAQMKKGNGAIMPVVFTSLLGHRSRVPGGGSPFNWLGEVVYAITQTPQMWLDHQVREESGALYCHWDSPEGLFPQSMLEGAFEAYMDLLGRLADDGACWEQSTVVRLPASQRAQREAFNATAAPIPESRLDTLFLAQAEQGPQRAAILESSAKITYGELLGQAGSLAAHLVELGTKPNELIAVVLEKGWRQAVAVMAVHLAGSAYLPLDPALPEERRRLLLEEGQVKVVLTESHLAQRLSWPEGVRVVAIADAARGTPPRLPARATSDLAYCIYTSGSTGRPKGVMIEHRAAANTLLDLNERFGVGPSDRVFALSALGFDLSVYDIFGSLAAGAAIVMPQPEASRDPAHWLQMIREQGVTIWNSVPTLMEMLVDLVESRGEMLPASLRLVLMSGDWIPVTLPDRIRKLSQHIKVISMGGATEASIWSIIHPIGRVDPSARSIPYGRPMLNQRFYVLDERLAPRPDYVPGDLYIGGVGLAQGYFRDEETTRARFIAHPQTGERLYRTGDMGRFLPEGEIEFLGRKDFQVKIAGHRIELGEIEAVLVRHPSIREAVVAAPGERTSRRLVAYLVPVEGQEPPSDEALRAFLGAALPQYMVPAVFVRLEQLPLSSNGKVDRKALPEPVLQPTRTSSLTDARGGKILATVMRLVAEVLKRPEIEPGAGLLQMGATSVELIKLAMLLEQEFGSRPTITEILSLRNASEIAGYYVERQPVEETPESKATEPSPAGIRRFEAGAVTAQLASPPEDDERRQRYFKRLSHRTFSTEPLDAQVLGRLLSCLAPLKVEGQLKYQYGSAGGIYGVQTYLFIGAGRVRGLEAGAYYHDPLRHTLVHLGGAGTSGAALHTAANASMAERSAFSLFLVGDRRAISQRYGDTWRDLALIETGLMAQLLETSAAEADLGLCQLDEVRFEELRKVLRLEEEHVYLHGLVGGGIAWEEGSL
ncbi:non-ribosomal peptide synthetase [Stigmatella hybrida]|uniref:non-ribosomal peptide synthetase n=1 Tax=Stigmatella hybrida TaxID=394097 RepID=UPI001CDAD4AE|nr:non-ribosomal peptide synthetase [Stigmatella hybrida]